MEGVGGGGVVTGGERQQDRTDEDEDPEAAVAPGNASVTVTASDPGGLQGQQSFQVTVPNRPPLARGAISVITVQVGETESVDVSSYFAEPDGEALTYAAASSRPGVATVSVSGSTVRVAAVAKGTATVTVTATDPGGLSATQVFETMVPNRRPEPVGTISDQTVEVGDPVTVNLSSYFNDPDGDHLTYTARSSVSAVAAVSVSGSTVTITAVAAGSATITITARDPGDLTATQRFEVTVDADDDPFEELEGLVIGDDGSVRLTADNVTFGVGNGGCLNNPGIINGKRWEFHWTAWQRDVGSGWANVSGTRQTGRLCGYDLTSASGRKVPLGRRHDHRRGPGPVQEQEHGDGGRWMRAGRFPGRLQLVGQSGRLGNRQCHRGGEQRRVGAHEHQLQPHRIGGASRPAPGRSVDDRDPDGA